MLDAPPRKAVVPALTVALVVAVGFFGNPFLHGGPGGFGGGFAADGGDGAGGGNGATATPAEAGAARTDPASDAVTSAVDAVETDEYRSQFGQRYRPTAPASDDGAAGDDASYSLLNTDETLVLLWQSSQLELEAMGDATVAMWQRSVEEVSVPPEDLADGVESAEAVTDGATDTVDDGTDAADNLTDDGEAVVDDTVDDTTDTLDDSTGGTTDDTTDAVDDTVDDTSDTVDDTVDTTEDTLDSTEDTLTGDDSTPTPTDSDDDGDTLL